MTARINHFDTRAEIGLKPPNSVSRSIWPKSGGVGVHYGGAGPVPPADHAVCQAIWRSFQTSHLNKGWADIAYTAGFCNHGHVLAGRGYGVRTAANGTNDANNRYYAFCWLGGGSHSPTQAAYDALEWLIRDARNNGGAGDDVLPHSAFLATSCPGSVLKTFTVKFHNKPMSGSFPPASPIPTIPSVPIPVPKADKYPFSLPSGHFYGRNDFSKWSHSGSYTGRQGELDRTNIYRIQHVVGTEKDGYFAEKTAAAVIRWQRANGLVADGKVGPKTWSAMF